MNTFLKDLKPGSIPSDDQMKAAARLLFIELDMTRAFEQDYENTLKAFKEFFNAGRSRGAYETSLE